MTRFIEAKDKQIQRLKDRFSAKPKQTSDIKDDQECDESNQSVDSSAGIGCPYTIVPDATGKPLLLPSISYAKCTDLASVATFSATKKDENMLQTIAQTETPKTNTEKAISFFVKTAAGAMIGRMISQGLFQKSAGVHRYDANRHYSHTETLLSSLKANTFTVAGAAIGLYWAYTENQEDAQQDAPTLKKVAAKK